MDYALHGQGMTLRAGSWPRATVQAHWFMRKDMKRAPGKAAQGASVEQKAFVEAGTKKPFEPQPPGPSRTSGFYKRRTKNIGSKKKGRKSARRKR